MPFKHPAARRRAVNRWAKIVRKHSAPPRRADRVHSSRDRRGPRAAWTQAPAGGRRRPDCSGYCRSLAAINLERPTPGSSPTFAGGSPDQTGQPVHISAAGSRLLEPGRNRPTSPAKYALQPVAPLELHRWCTRSGTPPSGSRRPSSPGLLRATLLVATSSSRPVSPWPRTGLLAEHPWHRVGEHQPVLPPALPAMTFATARSSRAERTVRRGARPRRRPAPIPAPPGRQPRRD